MPIERCTLPNGGKGYRWGKQGKCYKSGKDAAKQGLAIEGPKKFKEEMSKANLEEKIIMQSIMPDRQTSIIEEAATAFKENKNA